MIISRALYGLRSSGQQWHQRFAACLRKEGFKPCCAEPDVWMRKDNNIYEYVAVYVNDLAFAVKDPKAFVKILETKYKFKLKGTGPLAYHLGADFGRDPDGTLYMTPKKYIDRMIANYKCIFLYKFAHTCSY